MTRDTELRRLIGGWFHRDAFVDGADSVDAILDDYLGDDPNRSSVRAAADAARRLVARRHDEEDLAAILEQMGFWLLPQVCGFPDRAAFLAHVAGRLDRAVRAGSDADRLR